jgi:hypothetical protein
MKYRRLTSYKATLLVAGTILCSANRGMAEDERRLVEITTDYQLTVAPLIQKACADCHSGDTEYPWYAMIPGISQWIKHDIEEARKHIEFSNGYPFQSHATPLEDLVAVERVIKEGSMPPLRYRLMHHRARLTEQEKDSIIAWSRRGQNMLRQELARAAGAP